jgi:predicted HTH transcriptional regulator
MGAERVGVLRHAWNALQDNPVIIQETCARTNAKNKGHVMVGVYEPRQRHVTLMMRMRKGKFKRGKSTLKTNRRPWLGFTYRNRNSLMMRMRKGKFGRGKSTLKTKRRPLF